MSCDFASEHRNFTHIFKAKVESKGVSEQIITIWQSDTFGQDQGKNL